MDIYEDLKFGFKRVYKFDNGYGVSIIWNSASYGYDAMFFEAAVLDLENNELCYDTPVTNDVVGFLDFYGVVDILEKVKALPPKS